MQFFREIPGAGSDHATEDPSSPGYSRASLDLILSNLGFGPYFFIHLSSLNPFPRPQSLLTETGHKENRIIILKPKEPTNIDSLLRKRRQLLPREMGDKPQMTQSLTCADLNQAGRFLALGSFTTSQLKKTNSQFISEFLQPSLRFFLFPFMAKLTNSTVIPVA